MRTVRVTKDGDTDLHADGGTVAYRVAVDGRWVGWVGDRREWRGWRYGGREWWACWREEGDAAARWNSFGTHAFATRKHAVDELVERAAEGGGALSETAKDEREAELNRGGGVR